MSKVKDWMNPLLPIKTRLAIADSEVNRLDNQIGKLLDVLKELVALNDWFDSERNESRLTHEGVYNTFHEGQYELWERARLLVKAGKY